MISCRLYKFKVKDQKGATLVEASIILPVLFLFTFAIILTCVQLFSVYSTYYACFQSLKVASTGPVRNNRGEITMEVEEKIKQVIANKLSAYNTRVDVASVIVRNDQGCFMLQTGDYYINSDIGCNTSSVPKLKILPNSWVTLEVPVKPLNLKFESIPLPVMRVRTTIKMYDWF